MHSDPDGAPPLRPMWRLLTKEDVRDHPGQVVFIVLVLFATLVLPAIVATVSITRRLRATEQVTGTVVKISKYPGKRSTTYVHEYEYTFEGRTYEGEVKAWSSSSGTRGWRYEVGEPVKLLVDPRAPHRSYRGRALPTGSFAALFLFWGAVALASALRRVPSGRDLLRPRHAWRFAMVFTAPVMLIAPLRISEWWVVLVIYGVVLGLTALWTLWLVKRKAPTPKPVLERGGRNRRGRRVSV